MSTVAQRLPADRRFEFSSDACPEDTFAVVRMSGVEAISKPYRFELVLVSDDAAIDFAKLVGAGAQLSILAPDDLTRATPYAGMLAEFDQLHRAGGFTFYRAVLVPRMWQLSLYRNSEVYLNEQTIPQIVESLLAGGRFSASRDYALKLTGAYRPHSYVCQYQETPLAFVSRWLEREGIYFYFEQDAGADRLVLLDHMSAQPAQALAVNYRPVDEFDVGLAPDSVQAFVCRSRMLPRTLVLQDYNHRRASVPLEVKAEVSASGLGEEMLYGENFRSEEEGQRYATIRAEELRCGARVFSGEATAVGLRSGHFMNLSHHYREDFNGRYLVTEITHEGSQAGALLAGLKTPFNDQGERQTSSYRNSFVALTAATQFRPARTTPKPRVSGTMNATIDAEGSGEYAELDDYGQYKVQIPFDRTEKGAAKGSRPMRMASPYAGSDHGMHFPLHKGAEVLLSFIDGDPDRPVIMGAVPNSANPSLVTAKNPRLSVIQTKGGNVIGFDDTRGKEAIWLQSPYQHSALIIGSATAGATTPAPAQSGPPGPPAAPPRPPGGNVIQATKGGTDTITIGTTNVALLGAKNTVSLGTESSLTASFANKVTLGTSLQVNFATDIKWNLNAVLPNTDWVKSVTIDDSDAVTLKKSFTSMALDAINLSAGASNAALGNLELKTKLNLLRGLVFTLTSLQLAQNAVLGMSVNKSVGDTLTPRNVAGGLMGWGGIAGTLGADAVTNVASIALIQSCAKTLADDIKKLTNMSRVTLDQHGIRQTVNEDPVTKTAEGSISLKPTSGIEMAAPQVAVNSGKQAVVNAGKLIELAAPKLNFWGEGTKPASISVDGDTGWVGVETPKSLLGLEDGKVTLNSPEINVGYGTQIPDPVYAVLKSQKLAAEQALVGCKKASEKAASGWFLAGNQAEDLLAAAAWSAACEAEQAAEDTLWAIQQQMAAIKPTKTVPVPVFSGLAIDAAKTALTHAATSIKLTNSGAEMSFGAANFKLDAMGLSGSGPLIKLG